MKKWLAITLTLTFLLGATAFSAAESTNIYQLGDRMEDFSATLSDGTTVTLYGLLKEKKAVLINFWASWCGPCKMEFPFMEQAYKEMSDDIGIVALSCEKSDTDEIVLALKQTLGLDALPMGLDTGKLGDHFVLNAIPTSVVVDRNGVICFMEARSITSKDQFIRLFSHFTADDYAESKPLNDIPSIKPTAAHPAGDALLSALGVTDARVTAQTPADDTAWPFVPTEDGASVQASNGAAMETVACLSLGVETAAGEALAYEYALSCPTVLDSLTVTVDGKLMKFHSGEIAWTTDYAALDAGVHTVEIAFKRGLSQTETASAAVRGVRVLPADEVRALDAQKPSRPHTLEGNACAIAPIAGRTKTIAFTEKLPDEDAQIVTMELALDGALTLRAQIGKDVDENIAFLADGNNMIMLSSLPSDDVGYLYEAKVVSMKDGNAAPFAMYLVGSSAVKLASEPIAEFICFASEADIDTYVQMNKNLAQANGFLDYQLDWAYADGSPKESEAPAPASAVPAGMAEYRIAVVDEAGAPVQGAMLQICDADTCKVAATDADGRVVHTAAPYPFEIHVLKAPADFARDAETYVMPEAGGEITITLHKQ